MMKILQHCRISPSAPPTSVTSLPLTYLDLPWLFFPPSRPLFFYDFPYPTSVFTSTLLPNLKNSLSLTLQLFHPFAGTLLLPPHPAKPAIVSGAGGPDSVSFTVAHSDGDFAHLSSHCQRDAREIHALAPDELSHAPLRHARADKLPLLAIRVTVFPNSGFCLGLAFHHVVADERTFNNFMKTWSSFSASLGGDLRRRSSFPVVELSPCYDRTAIVDSRGLEAVFLNEWGNRSSIVPMVNNGCTIINDDHHHHKVRATFSMSSDDMDRIKTWILTIQCSKRSEPHSLYLSPYVLTCAFVWVCLLKAQEQEQEQGGIDVMTKLEDPNYFGFVAGGLTRVDYPVRATYFGNCVGFGRSTAARGDLLGEDGILVAARAIGSTIKRLDKSIFGGAEKWISEWEELIGSDTHVMVSGSPKVGIYERDFGWGRPKKVEEIEIDSTKAISLSESRDMKGGMEIGLVLPKPKMNAFTVLFKEGLKALSSLNST